MIKGPVEALGLIVLSAAPPPVWTSAHDWYLMQGILMGAALGAIVADAPIKVRIWRIIVSVIVGYMCSGFVINMLDQQSREGIRFIAGGVAFLGWWVAKSLELVAPSATKKTARALSDSLVGRLAGVGVDSGDTDRAKHFYDAIKRDQTTQPDQVDGNETRP